MPLVPRTLLRQPAALYWVGVRRFRFLRLDFISRGAKENPLGELLVNVYQYYWNDIRFLPRPPSYLLRRLVDVVFHRWFPWECCTTPTSFRSPIGSTQDTGFPRACPHYQTRRSVLGRSYVPVDSSLVGTSGRYGWDTGCIQCHACGGRSSSERIHIRDDIVRRLLKLRAHEIDKADETSVAGTLNRSYARFDHARKQQLHWHATLRVIKQSYYSC
jgi:hypothetical protein